MEGLLRNSLEQIIEDCRLRLVETIGRTEETWQPYNLQTKSNLKATLRELDGLRVDMRPQVTGDTRINLAQSTVSFCRHFMMVTESCGYLAKKDVLKMKVEVVLKELFLVQHSIKNVLTYYIFLAEFSGSKQNLFNRYIACKGY